MTSGLILIVAVIIFVIFLAVMSNVQGRITKLQIQLQILQKRLDQLTKTSEIALTKQIENTEVQTTLVEQSLTKTVITPSQDVAIVKQNQTAPSLPPHKQAAKTTSNFKPITAEERAQNQIKQTKKRDENSLSSRFMRWLINGNPVAKVAIIILFFGIAYLLKYSIDNALLSPEIRILGSLVVGISLLVLGWYLRARKLLYALILQGGAIGILYLTIFAAFKLYALVPLLLTFALLLVVCATSVVFAVLQRTISLAVIACVGGYLAPILLSENSGNHIALFSYYLLISCAILAISIWQSWRPLNFIGFLFTFIVAVVWGDRSFQPDYYFECQLFILANMLIYGVLAVLLSVRSEKKEQYQHIIDLILLFSVPLSAFTLQYLITEQWEFAGAFSALGFGLFYLVGSFIVLRLWKATAKRIALYGLAIGLGFSTLAVPLALSSEWTSLVWLFEGTAISWAALTQKQYKFAWIGSLIICFGLICTIFATQIQYLDSSEFITLYGVMSGLLLFNGCLWHHYRHVNSTADALKLFFIIVAVIAWSAWIIGSVCHLAETSSYIIQPIICCFVIAVWLWFFIGKKFDWPMLRYAVIALWPVLLLSLASNIFFYEHTDYASFWGLSWIIAFISGYAYLYIDKENLLKNNQLNPILHVSLLWITLVWLYYELNWLLSFIPWGFDAVKWAIHCVVAGLIILGFYILQKSQKFPISSQSTLYWRIGLLPVGVYLLVMLLTGLYHSGQIIYWHYLPLINPLEEGAAFALIALAVWLNSIIKYTSTSSKSIMPASQLSLFSLLLVVGLIFLWGNSVILRSLSQWLSISWSFYALWHTNIVQVVLSLIWTLTSVVLIIIANRYSMRNVWFAAAILQGIVVVKLVFVDSVALDGLMRAFVFIGVALLMLIIGYLAPLPPKQTTKDLKIEQHGSTITESK